METKDETIIVGFRTTKKFKELMDKYVTKDTHLSLSEFIRSAVREKLQRDDPNVFKEIFEEEA